MPDQKGRLEILKVHARNKKIGEDVDLKEVASRVPGFTGADLANLLNEVRFIAACRLTVLLAFSWKHISFMIPIVLATHLETCRSVML